MKTAKEPPKCFYHEKRHLSFDKASADWIVQNAFLCEECKSTLRMKYGAETKQVVLNRDKVYQKPQREIGEEG